MDAAAPPRPHDQQHASRWIILAFLGLAQLMVVLDATIVNIALPSAQKSLGFSFVDRQWLITAYSLAFGSILFFGGRLSDVIGRKTTLQIGLLGFAVASAIGGASTSFDMLVAARAIQGAFGAILAPAALALLTTTFTNPDERGKAFGIYGSIAGAGAAVGLLLGGVLTEYLDWRSTLYVNLFFAGIAIVGTQLLLTRERGVATRGLDVPSTVLISSGLFGIVYGLSHAANVAANAQVTGGSVTLASAFSNVTTIACIVAGVVLVALFVWRQVRATQPMLPLPVVADRARGGSFLAIFIAASSMFAIFLFLSYYLQYGLGYSPLKTGLSFMPMVFALVVASATSQIVLLPRLGPRPLVPVGMVFGATGMFLFTHISVAGDYAAQVLPALLVAGIGMGVIFSTSMNTATARVRPEYAGATSATVNVVQQVGGSLGTALLSTVSISAFLAYLTTSLRTVANVGKGASAHPLSTTALAQLTNAAQVHGYKVGFTWAMVMFAIGAVVTLIVLPSGKPQRSPVDHERERELVAV
jgi:EmrB/QacA subfamily drug resistance transporter